MPEEEVEEEPIMNDIKEVEEEPLVNDAEEEDIMKKNQKK